MTRQEQAWLDRITEIGCIACKLLDMDTPAEERHHIREGTGGGQRRGHFLTIPLCREHHQGRRGVHANGHTIPQLKMDELDLFEAVLKEVFKK
jgi:Recombination enhancement, RecA-dependent nuclease